MNAPDFRASPVGKSRGLSASVMRGTGLPAASARTPRDRLHVAKRRRLVERDADVQAVAVPEIQSRAFGNGLDAYRRLADAVRHLDAERVECTSFCWR